MYNDNNMNKQSKVLAHYSTGWCLLNEKVLV